MKKLNDKIKSTKDMDKINSLIDDVIEKTLKKVKLLEELRSSIAYENCEYIIRKTNSNQDGLIELSSTFYLLYKKLDNNMMIDEDNNLHVTINIKWSDFFLSTKQNIEVKIGSKMFYVPVKELFIRQEQYYRIKTVAFIS